MKQRMGPDRYRAVLFDIDNTLYRDDAYAQWQIDVLIRRFAAEHGLDEPAAVDLVEATRRTIARRDGRRPSLGNTMAELGVPIATSVAWRSELIDPFRYLAPDVELAAELRRLTTHYRCAALTNNPETVGRRSLEALGLGGIIETVIGLDTTGHSKPDWEPFAAAIDALDVAAEETVIVGDRWDVDLAPLLDRGGGGVLVESRSDLLAVIDALIARGSPNGGHAAGGAQRPGVPDRPIGGSEAGR